MNWAKFAVLYAGALLGVVAIAPYSLRLIEQSGWSISPTRSLLFSLAQNAVLFFAVIAFGLLAARAVGFGAPCLEAALGGGARDQPPGKMLAWAIELGAAGGALLLTIDLVLIPRLPTLLDLEHDPQKWIPLLRQDHAQGIEIARILIDQMIPSGRKAR